MRMAWQVSKQLAMRIAEDPTVSEEHFRSACLLLREKLLAFAPVARRLAVEQLLWDAATVKAIVLDKLKPDTVRVAQKRTRSGNLRSAFQATDDLKAFLEYVPMQAKTKTV